MMKRIWVFLLPGILLLGSSCERTVDLDLEEPDPRLAVVGTFYIGGPLEVEVTRTRSVLADASTEYLLNATVRLFEGSRFLEQLILIPPQEGKTPLYISQHFVPRAGQEYRLEVSAPGFDPVFAQSTVPEKVDLEQVGITLEESQSLPDGRKAFTFNLSAGFRDPSPEKNYYHLYFYLKLEANDGVQGDTSANRDVFRSIVFSPEVNNNYQTAHYDGGVLLDDAPFQGGYKVLRLPVTVELENEFGTPTAVVAALRTVPLEYYQFYNAVNRQRRNPALPFSEPVILFSNMSSGVGVFAGYNQVFLGARIGK